MRLFLIKYPNKKLNIKSDKKQQKLQQDKDKQKLFKSNILNLLEQ